MIRKGAGGRVDDLQGLLEKCSALQLLGTRASRDSEADIGTVDPVWGEIRLGASRCDYEESRQGDDSRCESLCDVLAWGCDGVNCMRKGHTRAYPNRRMVMPHLDSLHS
jgi:hypothetical protein